MEGVRYLSFPATVPTNSRIAQLYYTMTQGNKATVTDFVHRFCEVHHDLKTLVPTIHSDSELIYAFFIKLRGHISREIFSGDFIYKTLQSLIAAAQLYETIF